MKPNELSDRWLLPREAFTYVPTIIMGPVIGLLATLVYTRLLSPGVYGAYVLALASLNIAVVVTGDWLGIAPVQFLRESQQEGSQSLLLSGMVRLLGVCFFGGAVLYLILLALAGQGSFAVAGLLLLPTLQLSKGLMAMLRARLQTARYVWINCAAGVASLGMAAGFYVIFKRPQAIFFGAVLVGWLQIAVCVFMQRDILSRQTLFTKPSSAIMRQVIGFSLGIPLIAFGSQILVLGDRFFLAHFHGDAAAGLYAANYALAEKAMGLIFAPLMMAVYPMAVARWAGDKDRAAVASLLRESGRLYLIGGAIALTLLGLFSAPLSGWLLSAKFREDHGVIPWVALGVFFWGFAQLYHQGLYLEKRTKTIAIMIAAPVAVNLALNWALIPRFGARGAAWATAASYFLYLLIARSVTRRLVGFYWDPPWTTLFRCGGAVAATVLLTTKLLAPLRLHFILGAVAAGLGYLLIVSLLGETLLPDIPKMVPVQVSDGQRA
jgi:O-antigen/teichoic acid export membrane protein